MRIFKKSILLKLWAVMVFLVLIVLWLTGFVQTRVLKQTYYRQHLEQLTSEGLKVVKNIAADPQNREDLGTLSHILGLNIMIVDEQGYIRECRGMGMDMSPADKISVFEHHGIPWGKEEFNKIVRGETLHYIGQNNFLGQNVLSVALPYEVKSERGIVIVSAPLAPITDRIAALQNVTLYTGIGGIILATLLSLVFSRSVSYPLIKMNRAALSISRGDYSKKLDFKREDEIGVLANTLNFLAAELQKKIADIERLDNIRRDFIASVSHELRTPLAIMQVCTEALVDGMTESEDEKQEYLNNIHQEILRLRRLVSEVLDLRKLETGKIDFDFHPVNAAGLIQETAANFAKVAADKKINLQYSLEDGLPTISGNSDKLKQVLINLLDNALRATPEGGEVSLRVTRINNHLKFTVKDTGPGINESEQKLIWERFYKVDRSRNRSGSGTGLGLPIAKKIIEAHGGEIWVESKPGQGAAFIFTIPAND